MARGMDPPICNRCNKQFTVNYISVECQKFIVSRRKYFNNPSLINMLSETDEFSLIRLVLYLQEIKVLNNI